MHNLTPEGHRLVDEIARRHAVSSEAVLVLLDALRQGNGYQAQFNHPDLGGMGQWSQGGMIMVGDMFNQGLKYRVDALCNELAALVRSQPSLASSPPIPAGHGEGGSGVSLFVSGAGTSGQWWPAGLGQPSSSGAQNDMRYAFFADQHRLAIQQGGLLRVYDTGNHNLHGFSQQQSGDQSVTFTSQFGVVRVADLPLVSPREKQPPETWNQSETSNQPETWNKEERDRADETGDHEAPIASEPPASATPPFITTEALSPPAGPVTTPSPMEAILRTIEGLAALREKGILTDEEFAAKKTDLLSRL